MTAIECEGKSILDLLIENFKYFTLFGFHCKLTSHLGTDTFYLTVFYDEDYEKDIILRHTTLKCIPSESNGTKWIEMLVPFKI